MWKTPVLVCFLTMETAESNLCRIAEENCRFTGSPLLFYAYALREEELCDTLFTQQPHPQPLPQPSLQPPLL